MQTGFSRTCTALLRISLRSQRGMFWLILLGQLPRLHIQTIFTFHVLRVSRYSLRALSILAKMQHVEGCVLSHFWK